MTSEHQASTGAGGLAAIRAAGLLLVALLAGCSLSAGGLGELEDGGGGDLELDVDGRVDRGDDGDGRDDRGDDGDARAEDGERDEAVEEIDADEEADAEVDDDDGDLETDELPDGDEAEDLDGEADAEEEVVEDVVETETGVCDPGGLEDHCSSDILQHCRPDAMGWDVFPCAFGCTGYGLGARCLELAPSNITDRMLLWASTTSFVATGARVVVFETETGAIRAWDAAGAELAPIRAAGEGDVGGIVFTPQAQGAGAPDLGIWSFGEFIVPAGVDVIGMGARAMVLLVAGEVRISGIIHVGASVAFLLGSTWVGHDRPGPGGAAGGSPDSWGSGAGAGQDGRSEDWPSNNDSGGGGAGFGGVGGPGGDIGGASGGNGGVAYGTAALMPLLGGSGGGGGGDGLGGRGGHGGGALEIVSAAGIWISAGGGVTSGGGFGSGGRADGGGAGAGGGAGSGGAILLEAPRIDIGGGVATNGGGGGAGARDSDTWGNNGANGRLATASAAGGAGGGNGTSGGVGSNETGIHGGQGEDSSSDDDAGGGGGAAGHIRLNALVISIGGFVSPGEATALATRGTLVLL
ncbi:MAG: hypothetical protein HY905_22780 [Deltaproteobacteria bacterium]|nr:hypothetical protein [Deltaproteobacteria bacterium]